MYCHHFMVHSEQYTQKLQQFLWTGQLVMWLHQHNAQKWSEATLSETTGNQMQNPHQWELTFCVHFNILTKSFQYYKRQCGILYYDGAWLTWLDLSFEATTSIHKVRNKINVILEKREILLHLIQYWTICKTEFSSFDSDSCYMLEKLRTVSFGRTINYLKLVFSSQSINQSINHVDLFSRRCMSLKVNRTCQWITTVISGMVCNTNFPQRKHRLNCNTKTDNIHHGSVSVTKPHLNLLYVRNTRQHVITTSQLLHVYQ